MPGDTARRPISVEPGRKLREECALGVDLEDVETRSRPWYAVVNRWRSWYRGYLSTHIEFEGPDGETVRTRLENSYQPEYGKRYYAKLKDLERGISRRWSDVTTAMLTFSASSKNANGDPRCPGDHMRDIADGWDTARKQLHKVLKGETWTYAKVWEPHEGGERGAGGYGHMHVAVFVEDGDGDLGADTFGPVMESYVSNTAPAGWDAHRPDGDAVSVNGDVENLGSYISEYIGIFGEETLSRPVYEQAFYAVTWATGTRRVEFANDAQDIIAGEQFRRETGLRPEDRGATDAAESGAESGEGGAGDEPGLLDPEREAARETPQSGGWKAESICAVRDGEPEYHDPAGGGVAMVTISGSSSADPPPEVS